MFDLKYQTVVSLRGPLATVQVLKQPSGSIFRQANARLGQQLQIAPKLNTTTAMAATGLNSSLLLSPPLPQSSHTASLLIVPPRKTIPAPSNKEKRWSAKSPALHAYKTSHRLTKVASHGQLLPRPQTRLATSSAAGVAIVNLSIDTSTIITPSK